VGRADIVQFLIEQGADTAIRDTEHALTALEVARNARHGAVVKVFYTAMGSHKAEDQGINQGHAGL
jgi:hypothetical protein